MFALDNYFNRIDYNGSPAADLATLRSLHELHPAAIPFENLDVLLSRSIKLALPDITAKLLEGGRGGYCFEQNGLLLTVMRQIGFTVEPLLARVMWRQPPGTPVGPKSHMVLRVSIDGEAWLVDVGFGGLVLTAPLRMIADLAQPTQHETFRLVEIEVGFRLEVELEEHWHPIYELSTERTQPIDFEVANWYTSTHPDSRFRNNLMVARATPDTRFTLLNNQLSIRERGAAPVKQSLDAVTLANVLAEVFLLPTSTEWQPVLDRLVQS